ncbi:acetylcholine receptor subunit alpha-like 1 [Dreissena polymorpha]|uniref:Uncharacterized protein n=1 Tax=Dreissena polymorpha TaxID=45954 RepID=A0A9D4H9M3_DREPO|nr:acetylcholine receptor subunit alpha-like 1 [Dreissena polymorpha]KAH3830115.1 hypothetical protein DPMN_103352 [Dreissena polymorpha]
MADLRHWQYFLFVSSLLVAFGVGVNGRQPYISDEQRLHHHLIKERRYSKLCRPPGEPDVLTVKLGMRLSQIIDVSERNQIITTNVWLRHEWIDKRIRWDPTDFGNVTSTYFPIEDIWRPDIVLYNNADGDFAVTLLNKAYVRYTGLVIWEPPAIYKSYCPINVEYFPFDEQECFMKFSSWTFNGKEIDLRHIAEKDRGVSLENNQTFISLGVDLCEYSQHVEWNLINVTAKRNVKLYPCCPDAPYPDITFYITLRRKTLFYTINLIMPIMAISLLTVLVFYLPYESGEKITLSISIFLTLTVFFLLLSDMNPPTSLVIPLLGKYLLFTMIVVTLSIVLTVTTLSIYFRSPSTHKITVWQQRVFTEILPQVLCMKRPNHQDKNISDLMDEIIKESKEKKKEKEKMTNNLRPSTPERKIVVPGPKSSLTIYPENIKASLKAVRLIADHLKKTDDVKKEMLDWNYIAMVLDRLFLMIFTSACAVGSIAIFLNAPSIHDPKLPLSHRDFNCSQFR